MIDAQYKTKHHELPLVRVGSRVAVSVAGTSEWFRRSVQPHLREGVPVRIDAAEGYAYALSARDLPREPVLARRLVLRYSAGRLYLDSAIGTDRRPINLSLIFKKMSLEETAEAALRSPTEDTELSRSGLHPTTQSQIMAVSQQETALRLALLAQVLNGDTAALTLCVRLLGKSFDGCDITGDIYQQASEKLTTAKYAPHLRDLVASLIAAPLPSTLRDAAIAFCRHLEASETEVKWATEQLARV